MIAMRMVVLLVAGWSVGCSTYVNIPPQRGDHLAYHNPNSSGVSDIIVAGLRAAFEQRPVSGAYQVILPQGTQPETYAKLLPRLGDAAMWSSDGDRKGLPAYEVRQVRSRFLDAEVDIIRPAGTNQPQGQTQELITMYLYRYLPDGWSPVRHRVWLGDPEAALRMSASESTLSEPTTQP